MDSVTRLRNVRALAIMSQTVNARYVNGAPSASLQSREVIKVEPFSLFWLIWAVLLILGFVTAETIALYGERRDKDTLSRNIQWLVRHNRSKWVRFGSASVWAIFSFWFLYHIWFD